MHPVDDSYSSPPPFPSSKPRPSSLTSRSPSPGNRSTMGPSFGSAGGNSGGGMTYFLTEENNFGVHSLSESSLAIPTGSSSSNMTSATESAEVIDKPNNGSANPAKTSRDTSLSRSEPDTHRDSTAKLSEKPVSAEYVPSAIPSRLHTLHSHTSSVGSNVSPSISTPSSPRHNLSSSAISDDSELDLSSHHEEDDNAPVNRGFPQLVMPRVTMPRRKSFTEAGRTMGRLKVMVVGDSGIGKSSLIQAILDASPDIVHYDPPQPAVSPSSSTTSSSFIRPSASRRATLDQNVIPPTESILEIKASTRAYPSWWKQETERELKSSRPSITRRESTGEVLERNIVFVDTPGYGSSDDFNDVLTRVSGYIEENYERVNGMLSSTATRTNDLLSLFSNGINTVDLVIYVVLHRLKPVDITIMRQLSTLTNLLPIIAKSDTLSHTQTLTLKLSLLRDLRANSIPIFTLGKSFSDLERSVVNGLPWAISALRDDSNEMDASVLMSEESLTSYVASDLPLLVNMLNEHAPWLRFLSTKKFIEWRRQQESRIVSSSLSTERIVTPFLGGTEGYAMARVDDHIEREERLARVRLVQWASDMRKTVRQRMAAEQAEFERLESQERVRWLVTRLNEAIQNQQQEMSLVPVSSSTTRRYSRGSGKRVVRRNIEFDPLGLVWIKERWGPRLTRSLVWIVEAGVVLGSGWVVWKYIVDSGIMSGLVMQHTARAA